MSARNVHVVDIDRRICGISARSLNLGTTTLIQKALEEGQLFVTSAFQDVADPGQLDLLIRVDIEQPAVFLTGTLSAEGKAALNFFRDPIVSADGKELFMRPANTTTARTPTTRVFKNPTVTVTGVGGESILIPAGETKGVGLDKDFVPLILGPGDYLVRFTNLAAKINTLSMQTVVLEYDK